MKDKKKKTTFANVVITVCVAVALFVTLSQVWEYHRLNEPMPAGVVTAILSMWCGELLIVALRQIFGSDVVRQKPTDAVMEDDEKTKDTEDTTDIFGGSV